MRGVSLRPYTQEDTEFVLGVLPRFVEFAPPAKDRTGLMAANATLTRTELENLEVPGTAAFIAEGTDGRRLGYISLKTELEPSTGANIGYISGIAVAQEAEGRGIGKALMNAAESWARSEGYRQIALHVYADNQRARRFYQTLGYVEEVVRMAKVLD